ncbi:peptidoglycan DD-metalloendopeptidase family protein [uncultured Helicobacter sp.]|uniref:peptidoglycan DD-metalloendopeptidase family protein n=1 Tax=uncultured Helicobacter sp. TaxID=175537 RepID=UPI003753C4E2
MQNKLTISIIDGDTFKQFSVHKIIKRVLLYVLLALGVALVVYFVMVRFLVGELDEIIAEKNKAREQFQELYEKNSELARSVEYKTNELLKANMQISELEKIVSIHKNLDTQVDEQDIDLDTLSDEQKQMVLKIMPNGDPVRGYSWEALATQDTEQSVAHSWIYEVPRGTPVYATANGIVDSVGNSRSGSYGVYVKLAHSFGFTSRYAHLDSMVVQKGEFVAKGQLIGYSGQSGGAKKDGLLYELRFLGTPLHTMDYALWNLNNFNAVTKNKDRIDWKSLVWALDDLAQIHTYRTAQVDSNPNKVSIE